MADIKWKNDYECRKCGHTKFQVRKDFPLTCNLCSDKESPGANTLFPTFKIDGFSAKSLKRVFAKHIDINAKVTTDEWKGYKQIAKQYNNITEIPSNNG